jgi:hypothetical protein
MVAEARGNNLDLALGSEAVTEIHIRVLLSGAVLFWRGTLLCTTRASSRGAYCVTVSW